LQRIVINESTRLKTRRAAQMRDIAKRLHTYANFAKRLDLELSIPGTGERPPLALILRMPEPGRVSSEEAAAPRHLFLRRASAAKHRLILHMFDDRRQHMSQTYIAGGR
jgi:transposase